MKSRFLALCALLAVSALPVLAETTPAPATAPTAAASSFTPAQKQELQSLIRDYMISNPAVMQEALEAMQKHMQDEQARKMESAVTENLAALRDPAGLPVGGNPNGDVTIVEFFDYNCGYCKSSQPLVESVIGEDKNIRFIYREFPILSQVSLTAAEAALAANMQGKYLQMHEQLMTYSDHLTEEDIYRIAGEVGLDVAKLRTDMKSDAVQTEIAKTRALAQSIGIRGTPAFIIGTKLFPGALDKDGMTSAVAAARSAPPAR